jgi:hypothetical protein
MAGRISMGARREVVSAVAERYRPAKLLHAAAYSSPQVVLHPLVINADDLSSFMVASLFDR